MKRVERTVEAWRREQESKKTASDRIAADKSESGEGRRGKKGRNG